MERSTGEGEKWWPGSGPPIIPSPPNSCELSTQSRNKFFCQRNVFYICEQKIVPVIYYYRTNHTILDAESPRIGVQACSQPRRACGLTWMIQCLKQRILRICLFDCQCGITEVQTWCVDVGISFRRRRSAHRSHFLPCSRDICRAWQKQ